MWQPGEQQFYTPIMSPAIPLSLAEPELAFALANARLKLGFPRAWPGDALTRLALLRPRVARTARTGLEEQRGLLSMGA